MIGARPRKPWLAAILSLALPGLGHLYNGSALAAASAYVSFISLGAIAAFLTAATFVGLAVTLAAALLLFVAVSAHAYRQALRVGTIELRWFHRWYVYLLVALAVPVVTSQLWSSLVLPHARFRAYRIPTGSMEPTIRIGDHLFVDTWGYRRNAPSRGDIIVYRYPQEPTRDMIHRCVAVSGDAIEIAEKQVSLNGQLLNEPYAVHTDAQVYGDDAPRMARARDHMDRLEIPEAFYFCLGDNRDNSYDSRFWGPVPADLLRGKPLYFYWSQEKSRIGKGVK